MAVEARVDEAGRRVGQQAEPAEAGLAFQPGGQVVRQLHDLVRRAEDELARVQHQRLVRLALDQAGQVGLLQPRVDHGVLVVVEQPEEPVQPDVDAGRLDHGVVVRREDDPAGVDFGPDVAVGEEHGATVSGWGISAQQVRLARPQGRRGCSSMAEHQLPKLTVRVRFPSPAPAGRRRRSVARRSRAGQQLVDAVGPLDLADLAERAGRVPHREGIRDHRHEDNRRDSDRHVSPIGLLFAGIRSIIGAQVRCSAFDASITRGSSGGLLLPRRLARVVPSCSSRSPIPRLQPMFPIVRSRSFTIRSPSRLRRGFLGWITWILHGGQSPRSRSSAAVLPPSTPTSPPSTRSTAEPTYTLTGLGLVTAVVLARGVHGRELLRRAAVSRRSTTSWSGGSWPIDPAGHRDLPGILAFTGDSMSGTSNYSSHRVRPRRHARDYYLAISTAGITFSFLGFRQGHRARRREQQPEAQHPATPSSAQC